MAVNQHPAVMTVTLRAPLEVHQVPTVSASEGEVRVRVEWTASTPLDLHQADGGLLVKHPQRLGDGVAGTVVEIGKGVQRLKIGDRVFGFTFASPREKAHQLFVTVSQNLLAKIPDALTAQEAVTVPNNFVTAFHAIVTDLHLPLPWPKPADYSPEFADSPILIWGGSSSVGQYALQVLKYFGYRNLLTTASSFHHELLKSYGAAKTFDYKDSDVVKAILGSVSNNGQAGQPTIPFILDCIVSQSGSLAPLFHIAQAGTIVAILLPVIIRDASPSASDPPPEYSLDVEPAASWTAGVRTVGVRTHFYCGNEFHAPHLQPTIMPAMLEMGVLKPNKQRIVEGSTMLERAQKALDILRAKGVSGERLVWRVADELESSVGSLEANGIGQMERLQ